MSYLDLLKTESSYTQTLNGAKTPSTSGDACLDVFAVAGGMRHKQKTEQIRLFERAYIENPELAMKLLFYIRDIRGGLGERELFRTLLRHVARTWPASAEKNVSLIPEYGRYDDLLCLMATSSEDAVIRLIREQLEEDLAALAKKEAGEAGAHISLLAKWLPSANASSARTRAQAKVLVKALGIREAEYRKILARLRSALRLTECCLTAGHADRIRFEAVPAGAMLRYRDAFLRQSEERFTGYLCDVASGKKGIHSDTLYPYQILRPYFQQILLDYWPGLSENTEVKGEEVLELLWSALGGEVAGQNAISVIDTSGSMYCPTGNGPLPALISQALGLYYAEHCQGVFHNTFITFESRPHLIEIHGESLADKLRYIQSANWGGSTNLEAVFDLILRTAVNANASQEEMPSTLYIISDMEFNCAVRNPRETVYDNARKQFEEHGYEMPAVVFHNVNSWQMQTPVRAGTKGAALTSGAGTNSFQYKFDGNITPMDHMLRVLNSERYAAVHA